MADRAALGIVAGMALRRLVQRPTASARGSPCALRSALRLASSSACMTSAFAGNVAGQGRGRPRTRLSGKGRKGSECRTWQIPGKWRCLPIP